MSCTPDPDRLDFAFVGGRIERAGAKRSDSRWAAALEQNPESRAYVLAGDLVVLEKSSAVASPLFSLAEAQAFGRASERVLLGVEDGAARFALLLDREETEAVKRRGLLLIDLRSITVQALVSPAHLAGLAAAKALLAWHARHRFCSACGARTQAAEAGWRRDCPGCEARHFPRTDPVVIMLVTQGERCLLARQPQFAAGMWSCLAGFVEPGENIEEAARRETQEETGIRCGRVRYIGSQPWPFPMSLMIGCQIEALSTAITVERSELEDARWFAREEAQAMLDCRHPDGLTAAPRLAIAHHLIRGWVGGTR